MSLNKKRSILLVCAATLFSAAAIVSFLLLQGLPYRALSESETTYWPAEEETTALFETTVMPGTTALTEATARAGAAGDATQPHEEPDPAPRRADAAACLRACFAVSAVLSLSSLALLWFRENREACPEGIEPSFFFAAPLSVLAVKAFSGRRGGPVASRLAEGITALQTAGICIACGLFVWGSWTIASWCRQKAPVSQSLLYRITEKKALTENGFAWMLLVPAAWAGTGLAAALVSALTLAVSGKAEWAVPAVLFAAELAVSLCVLSDRIKAVRAKQRQTIEEAKVSERMRVDLIANVSHDLRTPLTSIIGYGDLLKKEQLSDEGKHNLAKLNEKSGYLREMVDAVFDLAKVSSGVTQGRRDKLDLIRLLEQTIGDHEDALRANHFEVKRHYAAEHVTIFSDGIFLHQVFSNLLSNAVKYTLPGTRIHLYVTEEGSGVTVRMSNISAYEMKFTGREILERFARGDESRNSEGSGLGLAIAQTYTEALGGRFRVSVDGDQFSAIAELPKP